VLAGESVEFAAEDSLLTLAVTCLAASAPDVSVSLRLTDEVVMDRAVVPAEIAANRGPELPENIMLSRQPVGRGDHLILSATNVDAAATGTFTYILELSPL
jgi:hypothetical protein